MLYSSCPNFILGVVSISTISFNGNNLLSVLSLTDNDVFGFEKKDLKSLTLIHFNGSVPDITPDAVYPLSFIL